MLEINPEEGIINGEDSETVELTVITEGYEAGIYNILIEIALAELEEERDDFEEATIQISGVVSLERILRMFDCVVCRNVGHRGRIKIANNTDSQLHIRSLPPL